jgi:hypothetical protein
LYQDSSFCTNHRGQSWADEDALLWQLVDFSLSSKGRATTRAPFSMVLSDTVKGQVLVSEHRRRFRRHFSRNDSFNETQ